MGQELEREYVEQNIVDGKSNSQLFCCNWRIGFLGIYGDDFQTRKSFCTCLAIIFFQWTAASGWWYILKETKL